MAQQGNQISVGAREGFAYRSVKLVELANGKRYGFDSNPIFLSGEVIFPFKILNGPNSDLF